MGYEKYRTQGYVVLNTYKQYSKISLASDELAKKLSSASDVVGRLGYYYDLTLEGDSAKLEKAMRDLAFRSGQKIPIIDSFYDSMKAEMDSDYVYIAKFAAKESAKEIVKTTEDITKPLAILVKNFWAVATVGIAGYVYLKFYRK